MTLPIPTVCSWIQEGGDSNYGPQWPTALKEICSDTSLWLEPGPEKPGLTLAISSEWPFSLSLGHLCVTHRVKMICLHACIHVFKWTHNMNVHIYKNTHYRQFHAACAG